MRNFMFTEKGALYEFRIAAKNDVDYGEEGVERIWTPDGSEWFLYPST